MHKMNKNIISLVLLTASFYALSASDGQRPQPKPIPSLRDLALQRVVQTMTSEESARSLARDPQKFEEYVESYGVNSGAIKNIIVGQLLKPYRIDQYMYKRLSPHLPDASDYSIKSFDWQSSGELLALGTQGYGRRHNSCPIFIYDPIRCRGNILRGHRAKVNAISWHRDGELLASGSKDATARVWNKNKDRAVKKLQGHQAKVTSVSWHPSGELLASGSHDRTVCIWDIRTGEIVKKLQGHQDKVTSVSWHPGGELLASGSHDRTVRIWDRTTGEELRQLRNQDPHISQINSINSVFWNSSQINSVAWNQDGRLLASGEACGLCIWDVQGKIKERHRRGSKSVIWAPEGKLLGLTKWERGVDIWDVGAHERLMDALSLMQALYFTHSMKHGDVMQAEMKCIEDVERQKRKQDYYNRGIFFDLDQIGYEGYINVRDIFFDFENVKEVLPTLKRKRSESSSSSSSSQKEGRSHSQVYMHDLEASLPDILENMLNKNNHKQ